MCVGMGRQGANIDGWIGCVDMCVCVCECTDGWMEGQGGRREGDG